MKTHCIDTLMESDLRRFSDGLCVGRVFNDKKGWYAGFCRSVTFDSVNSDLCLIRFDAFISFDPSQHDLDPRDPQQSLFTIRDKVKGILRFNELPFRLFNTSKIVFEDHDPRILIIQGDEKDAKKTAIISQRPEDRASLEVIPEFEKFLNS